MKKQVKIAIAIGIFIVFCIVIKVAFFSNNNDILPPPPPPFPPPPNPPSGGGGGGKGGYYQITQPDIAVQEGNLSLVDNMPIGFTRNFTQNYTFENGDIGSILSQSSFPINKCKVNGKYVTVVFEIDAVNFLDLSSHILNMTDTFYCNTPAPNNENKLMASLFLDVNMILCIVLSVKPQILVANYNKHKVDFDIYGNSTHSNIYINNFKNPTIPKSQSKPYFIPLPIPVSLQINAPSNYINSGLILESGQDISVTPYDSTKKIFLTQTILNGQKVFYISPDNTFSKYLKKSDCNTGSYNSGDPNVLNFPNILDLDGSILNTTCPATLFLTFDNNALKLAISHDGENYNFLSEITPFPLPTLSLQRSPPNYSIVLCSWLDTHGDQCADTGCVCFPNIGTTSEQMFFWNNDNFPIRVTPDNLGNYILGVNKPVFLIGPPGLRTYYQFKFLKKNPDIFGSPVVYTITESIDVSISNAMESNAVGTFLIVESSTIPNVYNLIVMFSDTTLTALSNKSGAFDTYPLFFDQDSITTNNLQTSVCSVTLN
jgi:hypothetical protein